MFQLEDNLRRGFPTIDNPYYDKVEMDVILSYPSPEPLKRFIGFSSYCCVCGECLDKYWGKIYAFKHGAYYIAPMHGGICLESVQDGKDTGKIDPENPTYARGGDYFPKAHRIKVYCLKLKDKEGITLCK